MRTVLLVSTNDQHDFCNSNINITLTESVFLLKG